MESPHFIVLNRSTHKGYSLIRGCVANTKKEERPGARY